MTYTLDVIRPMILEIIATKPADFVYEPIDISIDPEFPEAACRYRDNDGKPSCIVGHLFDKLGVVTSGIEGKVASGAISQLLLSFDGPTTVYLDNLQSNQDSGQPWPVAELEAYEYVTP